MMKNKLFVIYVFLSFSVSSCFLFESKESVIKDIDEKLQGIWCLKENPNSKIQLKNGVYKEYLNDTLKSKYDYKIIISNSSSFGYRLGYKYLQLYTEGERKFRYEIVETSFISNFETSFTIKVGKKQKHTLVYTRD